MYARHSQPSVADRGLAAGVIIALVGLVLFCPVMNPGMCFGMQHACQDHLCWSVLFESITFMATAFTWFLFIRFMTVQQGSLQRLFKPPRPLLFQSS